MSGNKNVEKILYRQIFVSSPAEKLFASIFVEVER